MDVYIETRPHVLHEFCTISARNDILVKLIRQVGLFEKNFLGGRGVQKPERRIVSRRDFPKMVPWFGVDALARTGMRDFTARLFGEYADQRILQAAIDNVSPEELVSRYDYSAIDKSASSDGLTKDAGGGVWVDYIADTGDGFNSTYSMASLLAQPELTLQNDGQSLPAGDILIMGGDQCYPYASISQYKRNLIDVYDLTTHHGTPDQTRKKRKLFALPGNHDWYDGLSAFDRLFCRRRDGLSKGLSFGQWECQQHRSYFAVKLPHNWWLWGLDIQLTANLDVGQIQYFNAITNSFKDAAEQPKIVIFIATPSWHTGAKAGTTKQYATNLSRILNLAIDKGKVCAIISGDWHHYSRYFGGDHNLNLITSGGGGAYMAPTHHLPNEIHVPWRGTGQGEDQKLKFTLRGPTSTSDTEPKPKPRRPLAIFPSKRVSKWHSWRVLAFPFLNWSFTLTLGLLYLLLAWQYHEGPDNIVQYPEEPNAETKYSLEHHGCMIGAGSQKFQGTCPDKLPGNVFDIGHSWSSWSLNTAIDQPLFLFSAAAMFFLIHRFLSAAQHPGLRLLVSTVHWLLHIALMSLLCYFFLWSNRVGFVHFINEDFLKPHIDILAGEKSFRRSVVFVVEMIVIGGFCAALLVGLYLFLGCRVFKTHADSAFSALGIANYKNFLRMRFSETELQIFPVGLKKVPRRRGWRRPTDKELKSNVTSAYVPRKALRPDLIEGPIIIRATDVRDL